jgi:hypothetical protein
LGGLSEFEFGVPKFLIAPATCRPRLSNKLQNAANERRKCTQHSQEGGMGTPTKSQGSRAQKRPDVIGAEARAIRSGTGEGAEELDQTPASPTVQHGQLGCAARARNLTPERRQKIAESVRQNGGLGWLG